MKTVEINLYKFEELSERAKQTAIEHHRNNNFEYFWADENRQTLEKFAEIFPIKVTNWSYGGRGEGVDFHFTCSDEIEELTGQRLATYIWNNYKTDLFKGKYFHSQKFGLTDHKLNHRRVKSRQITTNCPNMGKWSNSYYSAILLDSCCVLTGYCMDDEILNPIYNFLNKPIENISFRDLLESCFDCWVTACNNDIEYQNSDEYISDEIINNDCDFEEDGTIF